MGWAVENGAPELLKYLKMRAVELALVLPAGVTSDGFSVRAFMKQMNFTIPFVVDLGKAEHQNLAALPSPASIEHMCDLLNADPARVMVVAKEEDVLKAARKAGCITCQYRSKQGRRSSSAHDSVTSFLAVQTQFELLNGISYRSTSPFLQSNKYGPGE